MRHLILAVGLLLFAGLDVVFVNFSDAPAAALTFAVMSYMILLILSSTAGSYSTESSVYPGFMGVMVTPLRRGMVVRVLLAAMIPVALLMILAFIPDLDDPFEPSETIQLGSTFAVFWLLMSMALVGAVLGFLSPRTGTLEAVMVGGAVVVAQSLLSWLKVGASLDAVQLALYTWMVWVSICLIGAWVGLILRQIGDFYVFQARRISLQSVPQ